MPIHSKAQRVFAGLPHCWISGQSMHGHPLHYWLVVARSQVEVRQDFMLRGDMPFASKVLIPSLNRGRCEPSTSVCHRKTASFEVS